MTWKAYLAKEVPKKDGNDTAITAHRFSRETNGKVEKLFDEFEKKVKFFSSLDEWVNWYNVIRPHGALDLKTPYQAYYAKMPQYESLTDPSILEVLE